MRRAAGDLWLSGGRARRTPTWADVQHRLPRLHAVGFVRAAAAGAAAGRCCRGGRRPCTARQRLLFVGPVGRFACGAGTTAQRVAWDTQSVGSRAHLCALRMPRLLGRSRHAANEGGSGQAAAAPRRAPCGASGSASPYCPYCWLRGTARSGCAHSQHAPSRRGPPNRHTQPAGWARDGGGTTARRDQGFQGAKTSKRAHCSPAHRTLHHCAWTTFASGPPWARRLDRPPPCASFGTRMPAGRGRMGGWGGVESGVDGWVGWAGRRSGCQQAARALGHG